MNQEQIKQSILKAVSDELDQWLSIESGITSGYEYETKALEIGQRITKTMIEKSLGKLPKSRNQKKTLDLFRSYGSK